MQDITEALGYNSIEMPTIITEDGFQVRIYTDDHEPSHVHVIKAGCEVKINLGGSAADVTLIAVFGMAKKDVRKAVSIVEDNHEVLSAEWRKIHG